MSTDEKSSSTTPQKNKSESDFARWKRDATIAAWSGGGAALLMAVGALVLGNFGTSESRFMVESIVPTSRTLCSSIVTASATILALMLTVLSLTTGSKVSLDALFYKRIKQIAFYDMLTLAFSISFMVLLCVPITESEEIPEWWYPTVYYVMLAMSAILGGAMRRSTITIWRKLVIAAGSVRMVVNPTMVRPIIGKPTRNRAIAGATIGRPITDGLTTAKTPIVSNRNPCARRPVKSPV